MTITNGYATLVQVKSVDVLNFSDSTHDTNLEMIIEGVSRAIDNKCGRFFYVTTSQSRYYTAKKDSKLAIDDISSTSGLVIATDDNGDATYENTWSSTDYYAAPYNASLDGRPFEFIETTPVGVYRFPVGIQKGVKVTATFGWAATPKPITYACILQSTREYQRLKTALGVAGSSATGTITFTMPKLDPDVEAMLQEYVKVQF